MIHNDISDTSSIASILATLGGRLDALRLSRNLSQADLAREAGVSRSTVVRLADGQGVSLDSFVRILKALGLTGQLQQLLPDPAVRPVEHLKYDGRQRQRASRKRKPSEPWKWGDEE